MDTVYMLRTLSDSARVMAAGARGSFATYDFAGAGNYIGSRLYNDPVTGQDQIICQSCHMPHGVAYTRDDVYDGGASTPRELRVGPLLAINNAANWAEVIKVETAPDSTMYPCTTEVKYSLPAGHEQNLLCEWCHGITPDLESDSTTQEYGTVGAFVHPVNRFPTSTMDNMPSEPDDYSTLFVKYPISSWLKYRESLGIRDAVSFDSLTTNNSYTPGDRPNNVAYIVCLSCHEPHQAAKNSPILKFGYETSVAGYGDSTFCDGCHKDAAMGKGLDTVYFSDWTTHPSGRTAKLVTSDSSALDVNAIKLPNRAHPQD
jgi:hypothetical protein